MNRPTPLPWVKSWTSRMTDFDWLSLQLEVRAVFCEIVALAGIAWPRGVVKGTDEAVAAGIRADPASVTRAIDLLCAKPHQSLRRFAGGVRVVGWDKYQAPRDAISRSQRGAGRTMANSHLPAITLPGGRDGERRGRVEGEQRGSHPLLAGYPDWIAQPGDAEELDRLAKKYPLDLAEELRDFMSYADRRAGEGKAYVDYVGAFRNRLKSQLAYYKKRGWLPEAREDLTPEQVRERMRVS